MEGKYMLVDQMNADMLKAILETLPLEITVIDANDEVVGWNRHEDRLFKRPLTSMGLNFRNCHPETSLDKVIQIVEEMRAGKRDGARFWIDLPVGLTTDRKTSPPVWPKGDTQNPRHKILIEFYALRDDQGKYLGCMECTQDTDHIRKLEGEKRLLD
jgi:DUF438 domain-containing protein